MEIVSNAEWYTYRLRDRYGSRGHGHLQRKTREDRQPTSLSTEPDTEGPKRLLPPSDGMLHWPTQTRKPKSATTTDLCCTKPSSTATVQLTRNLNASVEYERFYSRVSMCETRALEHSYSSFTRRPDPSHSSTRTRTRALERSYSIRTRALQLARLDSNYSRDRTSYTKVL